MEFGINFFPSVGPEEMPAQQYWSEALHLTQLADQLGFAHARTVEHYFTAYGGYSPNPFLYLAAAATITKKLRLITGAILPIFNNPLKAAGEIGMVDAISGGRLEVGVARAFLPFEFKHFGRSLDESRDRFNEGVEQILLLLESENVSHAGRFHSFKNVTSLPRPTQKPRPPFWVAAFGTPESFLNAGKMGMYIMAIPLGGAQMAELIGQYREAWRSAGHPGKGKVMLSFSMCCLSSAEEADAAFRAPIDGYMRALMASVKEWTEGTASKDYPNYSKALAAMKDESFDSQKSKGVLWCGSPKELRQMVGDYRGRVDFDVASMHLKPHLTPLAVAERSIRLFAKEVMPQFL
jgi:alkanesulfonate monooxygenase SsuD/methylene tetrahydromethanopterin reductase-like flavin-dependent oxidoreductase (luciferase family)